MSNFGTNGDDQLLLYRESQTFSGLDGNDFLRAIDDTVSYFINGNMGNDFVWGGAGNDTLYGGQGSDEVIGEEGDDIINGNKGADYVFGGDGNDQVSGGRGADSVAGGNGNDTLIGGLGNDILVDGDGVDVFVFGTTPNPSVIEERDVIQEFSLGEDKIGLTGGLSFADLQFGVDRGHKIITYTANGVHHTIEFSFSVFGDFTASDFILI